MYPDPVSLCSIVIMMITTPSGFIINVEVHKCRASEETGRDLVLISTQFSTPLMSVAHEQPIAVMFGTQRICLNLIGGGYDWTNLYEFTQPVDHLWKSYLLDLDDVLHLALLVNFHTMLIVDLVFTGLLLVFCCLAVWIRFNFIWPRVAALGLVRRIILTEGKC